MSGQICHCALKILGQPALSVHSQRLEFSRLLLAKIRSRLNNNRQVRDVKFNEKLEYVGGAENAGKRKY